jgi:hypothetical protein
MSLADMINNGLPRCLLRTDRPIERYIIPWLTKLVSVIIQSPGAEHTSWSRQQKGVILSQISTL